MKGAVSAEKFSRMIPKPAHKLVLDTNVCLDLFVFRDPRWQGLLAAIQGGEVSCVTRADCRTEWTLVLAYARLGLDTSTQQAVLAEFDRLIALVPQTPHAPSPLPVCKDKDDQKFLELAATSGAHCLITKDKALLKLARRMRKLGLFEIMSPEQWSDAHTQGSLRAELPSLQ
jgi:putative PIN family toxin of toxin-antitoxin system